MFGIKKATPRKRGRPKGSKTKKTSTTKAPVRIYKGNKAPSVYKTEKKAVDKNKLKVNDIIYNLTKENRHVNKCALILESPAMLTTKALKKAGFTERQIEIPNFDKKDYQGIKRKHKNTYNVSVGEFLDMVENFGRESFDIAFLDYMCTLTGNKACSPKEDITKYYKYRFPKHNSILAITLSYRSKNGDVIDLISYVQNEARKFGMNATLLQESFSYPGMFVTFFNVQKI
ncbi:hypothetical protein [Oceanihabitans sediminis]|uniref:hypothetical protein n=1 Tax=Oceanihabitans sediminis TaxID=1812012 RepID=UPI00299D6EC0|nr:hypothetical protein [Oceanihabitans sediminis]MDX1279246.1 hypothetical protein [Oceanihabitans sediminis]